MKRLIVFILGLASIITISGQPPQKMSYQCVIRNYSGELVQNQSVGVRISILQGSPSGTVVFSETYDPVPETNASGLITVEIGTGIPVTGSFPLIDWAGGEYFIKTETDPAGGTDYTITGTSQLLSVPYALFAGKAANHEESDPVFSSSPSAGITTGNISDWSTAFSWGNHATAGYLKTEDDAIIGNEITNVANSTLTRTGLGTYANPYGVSLNLASNNTWTGSQTFTTATGFPGTGIWNSDGNVGIGTTSPLNKLQIQNGNLVIERSVSTSTLALGTVAGTVQRIFAGDGSGGSLNTNYNQIKLTANPSNTEELLRLHTGADAMSNTGAAAIYFGQFNLSDMAAIKAVNEGGQPLNRTAGLSFWTEPAGTGTPLLERVRISGNGNVGIGTTTPTNKLDVNGVISASGGNSTNWNSAYGWGDHATAGYLKSYTETDPKVGANTTGYSPRWDGTALTTGAIFQDNSGNVGIGTTGPGAKLEVIGNVKMSGSSSATAGLSVTGPVLGGPPAIEGISGSGSSVKGQMGTSGGVGVYGTSNNGNAAAIWGEMTSGGLVTSAGVYGKVAGTTGSGVYGEATSASGTNFGVYGKSASATGWGLYTPNNLYAGKISIATASTTSNLQVEGLPVYANNTAAKNGGLAAGAFYRTGGDPDYVCVVH
jgi:hypothetical protein